MSQFDLPKRFLHWYAVFVAASVLVLICSGGLVTSQDAGMAVPDWPNSFGYNMFLFPISRWVGGVFFEHTHRLIASGVGLLTVVLCVLTLIVENRVWVKWLAGIAVLAVIIQGILGGLRVTEHNAILGLFHGCLAQGFFLPGGDHCPCYFPVLAPDRPGSKPARDSHSAILDVHGYRNVVCAIAIGCLHAAHPHGVGDSRFPDSLRWILPAD